MFTRFAQCTIKPGRRTDFDRVLNRDILPDLIRQPGLVDVVVMYENSDPSEFVSLTFWKTKDYADRYGQDVYPRYLAQLEPLSYGFSISGYGVETSSMHRIAAGKAA